MLSEALGAGASEVDPSVGDIGAARPAPAGHYPAFGRAFRFSARFPLLGVIDGEKRQKSRRDDWSAPRRPHNRSASSTFATERGARTPLSPWSHNGHRSVAVSPVI